MRVIVAGSRDITRHHTTSDGMSIRACIRSVIEDIGCDELVSGGANGADFVGECYARANNIDLTVFEAKWERLDTSAGPARNTEMAEYSDALIAFRCGPTSGTSHMISIAKLKSLLVYVFDVSYKD